MAGLAKLDTTAFRKLWSPKVNSPERILHLFLTRELSLMRIGPVLNFARMDFAVNDDKYSLGFKAKIKSISGKAFSLEKGDRQSGCAHIRTPHARNACELQEG